MSIMLTFFIAIIVNLDNFFIGINLGICGQKLTIKFLFDSISRRYVKG